MQTNTNLTKKVAKKIVKELGYPFSMLLAVIIFGMLPTNVHSQFVHSLLGQPVDHKPEVEFIMPVSPEDMNALHKEKALILSNSKNPKNHKASSQGPVNKIQSTSGTFVQAGHTGAWFNRNQDGHGFFVEVLGDITVPTTNTRILAAWYAFLNGRQVWIVAVGDVVQSNNQQKAELTAFIYSGADFPPFFDSVDVREEVWGTITLEFNGCDEGNVIWTTNYPGYQSGQFDIHRLTKIKDSQCNPNLGGRVNNDDFPDSHSGAVWLTPPSGINGTLEEPGDVDVFKIRACPSNKTLAVWTTGGIDTFGELYSFSNNNEGTLLRSDDDGGDATNFLIEVQGGSESTIHVSGWGITTGPYNLRAECISNAGGQTRINFDNKLLNSIEVFQNGMSLGSVPAGEIRGDVYNLNVGDQFSFKTIQEYGDHMEGIYPEITDPGSEKNYIANNIIGSNWFFHPTITNNSSNDKLLGVNMELQSENKCSCTVPANTSNVGGAYFRLWNNSNLRLYEVGSNYSGQYWQWTSFSNNAQTDTGRINFIYP